MERILKIATRGSKLALRQYEVISKELEPYGIKCEPIVVRPYGERDTQTPLYEMKEEGVFVKALNDKILEGSADAAVHSAKDIPTDIDPELEISYFSSRADPKDYFVSLTAMKDFVGTVGTSSVRRKAFLGLFNRNMKFENIRGNIDTRISKWKQGSVDSIVVAKAALDRLELSVPGETIPESVCPPDPNQGFIAIVTKHGSSIDRILRKIQQPAALWEASKERELMEKLQLGCKSAVSIRADYSHKIVRFAYANEERRVDLTFRQGLEESDVKKLRDIVGP